MENEIALKLIDFLEQTYLSQNQKGVLNNNFVEEWTKNVIIFLDEYRNSFPNMFENKKIVSLSILLNVMSLSFKNEKINSSESFYQNFNDFYLRNETEIFVNERLNSITEEHIDFPEQKFIDEFNSTNQKFIEDRYFQPAFIFHQILTEDTHVKFILSVLEYLKSFYKKFLKSIKESSKFMKRKKTSIDGGLEKQKSADKSKDHTDHDKSKDKRCQAFEAETELIEFGNICEIQEHLSRFELKSVAESLNLSSLFIDFKLLNLKEKLCLPDFLNSAFYQQHIDSTSQIFCGNADWIVFLHKINSNWYFKDPEIDSLFAYFNMSNSHNENIKISSDINRLYLNLRNYVMNLIVRKFILMRKVVKKNYCPFSENLVLEELFEKKCIHIYEYIFRKNSKIDQDSEQLQVNFRSLTLRLADEFSKEKSFLSFIPIILSKNNDICDELIPSQFIKDSYLAHTNSLLGAVLYQTINIFATSLIQFNWKINNSITTKTIQVLRDFKVKEEKIRFIESLVEKMDDNIIGSINDKDQIAVSESHEICNLSNNLLSLDLGEKHTNNLEFEKNETSAMIIEDFDINKAAKTCLSIEIEQEADLFIDLIKTDKLDLNYQSNLLLFLKETDKIKAENEEIDLKKPKKISETKLLESFFCLHQIEIILKDYLLKKTSKNMPVFKLCDFNLLEVSSKGPLSENF